MPSVRRLLGFYRSNSETASAVLVDNRDLIAYAVEQQAFGSRATMAIRYIVNRDCCASTPTQGPASTGRVVSVTRQ